MKHLFLCLLFCQSLLFAKDYDYVFIGTSPIPLFEALYQAATGKEVLILEADSRCGGAWKAIDACSIANVDLGCHHIGGNQALADFLSNYAGCRVVSMADPSQNYDPSNAPLGLYFSQGCHELISNLETLIRRSSIDLKMQCPLENVRFEQDWAVLETKKGLDRAKKVFYTNASSFKIEGQNPTPHRTGYYHLYFLIADNDPLKFTYRGGFRNVSRIMNLTPFAGLFGNLQLLVLQICEKDHLEKTEELFLEMKSTGILLPSASLLKHESYVYEQGHCGVSHAPPDKMHFFQRIDTGHIMTIQQQLERWKSALKPW